MQRKGLRATVGGVDVDVPVGTWTGGQFLRYNAGTGLIDSAAGGGGAGDFVGPGASVDNHLVLFSGITGKLGKDSAPVVVDAAGNFTGVGTMATGNINGVAVAAHAARHLPGGADSVFPGTYSAGDEANWTGAAWAPKRRQVLRKTATQANSTVTLAAVTDLLFSGLKASTGYMARFVVFYTAAAATTGITLSAQCSSAATSQQQGAINELTASAALIAATATVAGSLVGTSSVVSPAINMSILETCFLTNAATNLQLFFASEVAASAITLQANCYAELMEV